MNELASDFRDPAIRVTLLPKDTNAHGTIFGGIILSYIDVAGAIGAHRLGIPRVVTVAMNGVVFHEPVLVGDIMSLYVRPLKVGRTSITLHVRVEVERAVQAEPEHGLPRPIHVTEAEVVYVAVDEQRKPISLAAARPRIEALIARGEVRAV